MSHTPDADVDKVGENVVHGAGRRMIPSATTTVRFRLTDPEVLADPYPTYRRMQADCPLYRERHFGWVLTRYQDVAELLRAPHLSAERPMPNDPIPRALQPIADDVRSLRQFQSLWMLYSDPPRHTRLRALVTAAFTPRMVARMRTRIEQIVDSLLDGAGDAGAESLDVIADLADPLPTTVIAELLGLPPGDRMLFKRWSDDIAAGFFLVVTRETPATVQRAYASQAALAAYLRELISQRRRSPRDDLLSALVTAEAEGSVLSEDELLATCVLLVFAGHETTTNLIGNGVLALLEHPDQLERLRADPRLLPSAIEELLRFSSPVQATARRATVDFELHGQRIRRGDFLLLLLGAANRDPAQFVDPDVLDIGRADNRHLAFSLGPHFCLGAALARLEAEVALDHLLQRYPRLRLSSGAPVWRQDVFLRGLTSLLVADVAA